MSVAIEYKDWVNVLLQCLAIGIVLSGIIGYLTIRNKAKKQATKVATQISEKIARDIAEKVANEYIQQNLPEILESYRSFFANNATDFDVKQLEEEKK